MVPRHPKPPLYQPLDEYQQEIRILTLHAGGDDTPIKATLEVTLISSAGSFIAFSYCWGPPDEGLQIILGGEAVSIRHNLWLFLRNFRSVKGSSRLWIDYLCIDQSNIKERNHQVRLMQEIFSRASSVYAWLGEATPETDNAIQFINYASSLPGKQRSRSMSEDAKRRGKEAITTIIMRQYWSRVWIVQEILLARKIFLMIGDRIIDWGNLQDVVTRRFAPGIGDYGEFHASNKNFRHILKLKRGGRRNWKFYDIVQGFRFSECHDPRDRIYGLLGLLSPSVRSKAVIDYTLPIIAVCLANIEIILDSPPANGRGFDPFTVRETVEAIFHDKRLNFAWRDRSQFSHMVLSLVLEARQLEPELLKTFAAYSIVEDEHVETTSVNTSARYNLYLTVCQVSGENPRVLFTTTHSRDWDFVLLLGSIVILPVRKVRESAGSLEVIEMGGSAVTDDFSHWNETPPSNWFTEKFPHAQCSLPGRPFNISTRAGTSRMWPVQLNYAAFVEMLRIWKHSQRAGSRVSPSAFTFTRIANGCY